MCWCALFPLHTRGAVGRMLSNGGYDGGYDRLPRRIDQAPSCWLANAIDMHGTQQRGRLTR
jgi:hypothetical protein